jgi:hypothetical protein
LTSAFRIARITGVSHYALLNILLILILLITSKILPLYLLLHKGLERKNSREGKEERTREEMMIKQL